MIISSPYDDHCQVAIILIVINYPHCYDHSRSQVAIPAENDVIDLTVTAQQGFGGRRPKPKKKYSGKYFFLLSQFCLFCYVLVWGQGCSIPRKNTLLFCGKEQAQGVTHCYMRIRLQSSLSFATSIATKEAELKRLQQRRVRSAPSFLALVQ